ncbi:MAG: hypothetical protein PHZ02_16490 [Desulfocapsaceae bacterium]|nr:hypothetical protein [Desulfocapsaceae bacterium]
MPQDHLEYYLAIESDLVTCSRFVDFSTNNFQTHSLEFARIILAASAEIDAVAKEFCKAINAASRADNILKYADEIILVYPNITNIEIAAPRHNIRLKPWDNWTATTSPPWWRAHNNIKHDRANNFGEANLENAIAAASGLLAIILYFYKQKNGQQLEISVFDGPKLFCVTNLSQNDDWENGGIFWGYTLP